MSDDQPENVAPTVGPGGAPVLRREALLPNERSRGLGTVAVVCTMAGVASGLALATTLMAMQVADSMSMRAQTCQVRQIEVIPTVTDRDLLGNSMNDLRLIRWILAAVGMAGVYHDAGLQTAARSFRFIARKRS